MKILVIALAIIPFFAYSQRDWDAIEIKTNKVTNNISYLEGSGGNIGVLFGEDGIMIIDDQFSKQSSPGLHGLNVRKRYQSCMTRKFLHA